MLHAYSNIDIGVPADNLLMRNNPNKLISILKEMDAKKGVTMAAQKTYEKGKLYDLPIIDLIQGAL